MGINGPLEIYTAMDIIFRILKHNRSRWYTYHFKIKNGLMGLSEHGVYRYLHGYNMFIALYI
jgi:hypothetical protein